MSIIQLGIPKTARRITLALAFQIINYASKYGSNKWGLTYFDEWGIRVNVGWTEIFTASPECIRLIVDKKLATTEKTGLVIKPGVDPRGYYPSIPGSALVNLEYRPNLSLSLAIHQLTPALERAIELAARRSVGRGVKAGHNQWAVRKIANELGTIVPKPGYQSLREHQKTSTGDALSIMEGSLKRVVMSRYERSPKLRQACVEHYGTSCIVCGFSFRKSFGPIGSGFIHVHHLSPISKSGVVAVNPIKDLRPICPNCHSMIHREEPPLAIDQLKELLNKYSK
jgi:hypothetical protein